MTVSSGASTKISRNSPLGRGVADQPPLGPERRNERAQHDEPGVGHQPRHLADAADVLDPVGCGEAQVLVETVADIVAVEERSMDAARMKPGLNQIGDRRFSRA